MAARRSVRGLRPDRNVVLLSALASFAEDLALGRKRGHAHVNGPLTMKRSRRQRSTETLEFAAMMRRMVAAHGRRVADGDVEDLADLLALVDLLQDVVTDAVRASRVRSGRSWSDIARAAGTTRQAAQQRWGTA